MISEITTVQMNWQIVFILYSQDGYDWGRMNLKSVTEEASYIDFLNTAEQARYSTLSTYSTYSTYSTLIDYIHTLREYVVILECVISD